MTFIFTDYLIHLSIIFLLLFFPIQQSEQMASLKEMTTEVTPSSTRPPTSVSSSSSPHIEDEVKREGEQDSMFTESERLTPIEFIYRYTGIVDLSIVFDFSSAKVILYFIYDVFVTY
jgi:hypothetical protein